MSNSQGIVEGFTGSPDAGFAGGMGGQSNPLGDQYMDLLFSRSDSQTDKGVLGSFDSFNKSMLAEVDNSRAQFQSEFLGGKAADPLQSRADVEAAFFQNTANFTPIGTVIADSQKANKSRIALTTADQAVGIG